MVQLVAEVGSSQRFAPFVAPTPVSDGLDRYRADWGASSAAPVASPAPTVTSSPNATNDAARTHRNALLANDVYNATPNPPPGTRVATERDLERLGLTPDMLEQPGQSSFRARVYVSGPPGKEEYTIAFRGSQDRNDWETNLKQGVGADSPHYRAALAIGRQIARSGEDVEMAGHSLGGGLAAAAALASGGHADTFNAAGLHDKTIDQAKAIASAAGRGNGAVDNYRVPGEILTFVQEGGDRLLGGVLGGLGGVILADAPPAYGRQHELSGVTPENKNFFERHSRIDRHGMDWVLASTAARVD